MIKHIIKLIWNKKRSNALMILEIFLSFLVLYFVLAYLFFNLERVNTPLGFEVENKWMIGLDNSIENRDSTEVVETLQALRNILLAQEEIQGASFTSSIRPFTNSRWYDGNDDMGFNIHGSIVPCDIDLKEELGLNIIEGRWFSEEDLAAGFNPLIVNKKFMDDYFPDKSMIDSTIIFGGERKLIGVVDHYRYLGEFEEFMPTTFNLEPFYENQSNVILSMASDTPASFEEKLSNIVNTTTKSTGSTIETLKDRKTENSRESWLMLIALLSICIFLCINVSLGLFGVLWYNINKRKSEIGLRQALGAHSLDIMKQFILEIVVLTVIAIVIGAFFAIQIPILNLTEYADNLFYKSLFYTTIIILSLVTICALIPSFQAAKITPANSLHEN